MSLGRYENIFIIDGQQTNSAYCDGPAGDPCLKEMKGPRCAVANNNIQTSKSALSHYIGLMDTRNPHQVSQYLADNVVLDWFGRTIVGKAQVTEFMFRHICLAKHEITHLEMPEQVTEENAQSSSMGHLSDTVLSEEHDCDQNDDSGFASFMDDSNLSVSLDDSGSSGCDPFTPCHITTEFSRMKVSLQDTCEDTRPCSVNLMCKTPQNNHTPCMQWCPKRKSYFSSFAARLTPQHLTFLDTKGIFSFYSYDTDLGREVHWSRDGCMKIGYSMETSCVTAPTYFLLVYFDNIPCRRNLSNAFDQLC